MDFALLIKRHVVVGGLVTAVVVLLGGALAIWHYHSRVAARMEQANAASLRGDWKQAQAGYERTLKELGDSEWLGRLLIQDYDDALIGEVKALYANSKYEEALTALNREAERSAEFAQDPRRLLWSGNLWFRKAIVEEKEGERRDQLNAAVDFYRKGLEVSPEQWDLKFNYELTSLILAQENPLQKKKREEQPTKRLLPRIRTDQERQRRVLPPEERG